MRKVRTIVGKPHPSWRLIDTTPACKADKQICHYGKDKEDRIVEQDWRENDPPFNSLSITTTPTGKIANLRGITRAQSRRFGSHAHENISSLTSTSISSQQMGIACTCFDTINSVGAGDSGSHRKLRCALSSSHHSVYLLLRLIHQRRNCFLCAEQLGD